VKRKGPTIRPGQRKPYSKATLKEVEQRVKAVAWFEAYVVDKSFILDFFQEVFGVEARQAERYLARARAREGQESDLSG
jgi:predicted enzyme related to lactoylglutathione lyase